MLVRARFTSWATGVGFRPAIRRLLAAKGEADPAILEVIVERMPVTDRFDSDLLSELLTSPDVHEMIQFAAAKRAIESLNNSGWEKWDLFLRDRCEVVLKWLGQNLVEKRREMGTFLSHCWGLVPWESGKEQWVNPILLAQATVQQRWYELLIQNDHRPASRAAIPFLWRIATSFRSGRRILLEDAIKTGHELHAISAFQTLYLQSPIPTMPMARLMVKKPEHADSSLDEHFSGPF